MGLGVELTFEHGGFPGGEELDSFEWFMDKISPFLTAKAGKGLTSHPCFEMIRLTRLPRRGDCVWKKPRSVKNWRLLPVLGPES